MLLSNYAEEPPLRGKGSSNRFCLAPGIGMGAEAGGKSAGRGMTLGLFALTQLSERTVIQL